MIKIVEGNILDATENIIVQQVNCKGVMGAGLAKAIADRYPEVKDKYIKSCKHYGADCLGYVDFVPINYNLDGECFQYVANVFGQYSYGRNKNVVYTNYVALTRGLNIVRMFALRELSSIAIPYGLGCGLANGDWNTVKGIIDRLFGNINIDVTIYKYEK